MVLDGIITFLTGIIIIFAFKFALYGKLNQGVISSLFATTSIYLALAAWIFFGESLRINHFIGMLFMITCAILIVFSKPAGEMGTLLVYDDVVQEISPIWGALFTFLCTFCFFARTILIKLYYINYRINPMDLTVLSYVFQGIIMCFVVFSMEFATFDVMLENILAGGFGFLGNVFINHATSKGLTGPAAAM